MKLATYKDGSRDGQLVVVSRDLSLAHFATATATRLQQVLDDWNFLSPQLQDLYVTLNQGRARHAFAFDPRLCMAPLPRACQWAEGDAYPSHSARLRGADAGGAPPLVQGAGDAFLGATDNAWFGAEAWDIDFGAGLAVATGDVAIGAGADQALDGVRLLLLVNSWRLRRIETDERARGLGFVQSRPAAAFGPVAVTPDELGDNWRGGRAQLTLQTSRNGKRFGLNETGPEMGAHFGELIAQLAMTRKLGAGTLVGAGTASQADAAKGFACIAEKRAHEARDGGEPTTPYLKTGEQVRIDALGRDGLSLFGAIEQAVSGPLDLAAEGRDEDADAGVDPGDSGAPA